MAYCSTIATKKHYTSDKSPLRSNVIIKILDTKMTIKNPATQDLIDALSLQRLDERIFLGQSFDFVGPRVFGGQVLAQALLAGFYSLNDKKPCHSLHAYFLRGGDICYPISYEVTVLRDGRTLSARQIMASQTIDGKQKTIFSMSASYAPMTQPALTHQKPMPTYPHPSTLKTETELFASYAQSYPLPATTKQRLTRPRPLVICPADPQFLPTKKDPKQALWLQLDGVDVASLAIDMTVFHQATLAFASDFYLLTTALRPHKVNLLTEGLQVASIDHSMHFYRPFLVNEWLLYELASDVAAFDRGLNDGQFWQDGNLVAATRQEGLMRYRPL